MKHIILLTSLFGISFFCFAQNAVTVETKTNDGNPVQQDQSAIPPGQAIDEQVAQFYYEELNIKDFFQKYPDYPRFIYTGSDDDFANYRERAIKWVVEHPDFKKIAEQHPDFKRMMELYPDLK